MSAKRKLWATTAGLPAPPYLKHPSKTAAYRHVDAERAAWASGRLKSRMKFVYVDERDGRGFRLYERIDLAEAVA